MILPAIRRRLEAAERSSADVAGQNPKRTAGAGRIIGHLTDLKVLQHHVFILPVLTFNALDRQ